MIYLVAVVTTLFANPILLSAGGLDLYLSTLAWGGATFISMCSLTIVPAATSRAVAAPFRVLAVATLGFACLVAASVVITGVHEQTLGNLFRLSFVAIGIAAALLVVRRAVPVVRMVTVLVGVKSGLVLVRSLGSDTTSLADRIHLRELGGHNSLATLLGVLIVCESRLPLSAVYASRSSRRRRWRRPSPSCA